MESLGIDNEAVARQELLGDVDSRLEVAARVATKVDDEAVEAFHRQLCEGDDELLVGILAEVLDLDIARGLVEHIGSCDAVGLDLVADDGKLMLVSLESSDHAQAYLGALGAFQGVHGDLVGEALTSEHGVVDGDDLVACEESGLLSWSAADDVLHAQGVVADDKLDAHAIERSSEVVLGQLYVLSGDIDGVGVELAEDEGYGLLDELVDIDRVDVLLVNAREKVRQLVGSRLDGDAQPVA